MDLLARERLRLAALAAMLSVLVTGCGRTVPDERATPPPDPITLAVPGRTNANVSLAADGAFVAAAWSASEPDGPTDIYAAVSTDAGVTFSSPTRVNSVPGGASASGEQPPRLSIVRKPGGPPGVVVIWTARGEPGTRILTARSADGGSTFGPSQLVRGTDAAGNRGWQAIAAGPRGRVAAAWLDHRELVSRESAEAPHHHHGAGAAGGSDVDSVAMAQLSRLYFADLDESAEPRPITGGVCYCCKTAMVFGANGSLSIAWRHVYDGNMRDIALVRSSDGGLTFSTPVRVSADQWSIAGCPDDGPAMAIDSRDRVHVVWPTVVTEEGEPRKALFYARSDDGLAFSPRLRIPTEGHANHPQVTVVGDRELAVAWDESGDGDRRIAFARGHFDASGGVTFEREERARPWIGVYPVVVSTPDAAVVRAWTSGHAGQSVIHVTRGR